MQDGGRVLPGRVDGHVESMAPLYMFKPTRKWAGGPATSSSATAKISPRAASMTGVPVMPTDGLMSPQGRSPDGTGVPTWVDQSTAPVSAASA